MYYRLLLLGFVLLVSGCFEVALPQLGRSSQTPDPTNPGESGGGNITSVADPAAGQLSATSKLTFVDASPILFGFTANGAIQLKDIQIMNEGSSPVTVANVIFPDGYSLPSAFPGLTGGCANPIATGVKCTVRVQFAPTQADKDYNGDVKIYGAANVLLAQIAVVGSTFPPGTLDATFGMNGVVTDECAGICRGAKILYRPATATKPAKLVVAGTQTNNVPQFFIAQYKLDGTRDLEFGANGSIGVKLSTSQSETLSDIALLPDGKIVAVGDTKASNSSDIIATRINADGTQDAGFGVSGIGTYSFAGLLTYNPRVAVQKIGNDSYPVVGAQTTDNSPSSNGGDFSAIRIRPNGTLDASFATGGYFVGQDPAGVQRVRNIHVVANNKILLTGGARIPVGTAPQGNLLAGLEANGLLDAGVGFKGNAISGSIVVLEGSSEILPDGKIVMASTFCTNSSCTNLSSPNLAIALARYLPTGALDPTFGTNGVLFYSTQLGRVAKAMALQPDGKILVAGYTVDYNLLILRFNPNGSVDTTFGNAGVVIRDLGSNLELIESIVVQPDGKLVVTGYSNSKIFLMRVRL